MLKNKALLLATAGVMALAGAAGGTALMASAQTTTTPNTPVVTSSANSVQGAVDKPETANDQADTDNVQAGPGSTLDQQGEHQDGNGGSDAVVGSTQHASVSTQGDGDGSAQSEASEPAGSSDTSEQ